jgi:hypothetical protein
MVKTELKTENGIEKFYYVVDVFLGTFDVYPSYSFREEFGNEKLRKAKLKALQRAKELEIILEYQGMFFLPFASPQEFVLGKNANYSITVSLVQEFEEDSEYSHEIYTIEGEGIDETIEALEFEADIFKQLSIS